mgnify:FL=1
MQGTGDTKTDRKFGKASKEFPKDDGANGPDAMMRKREKKTMKSVNSPYEPFEAFYPLNDIIDTYMEIWYKDESSDSDS